MKKNQRFNSVFFSGYICIALLFGLSSSLLAQVNISVGTTATQAFSIGVTATASLPTGWKADKQTVKQTLGTYSAALSATVSSSGNSMGNGITKGDIFNFGAGVYNTATERAVGGSIGYGTSSIKTVNVYTQLTNNGATAINSFNISYALEKYRNGMSTAGYYVQMSYSTDGTSWTSAGSNFLTSYTADADNAGFASAPGATTNVTNKNLAVTVAASSSLYLVWSFSFTGTDDLSATKLSPAIGLDDVSITAYATPGAPSITSITPGDGQLSVAFAAGSDGGSAITNYEYSINGGSTWATRQTGTTGSPIVITGLTNGNSYNVQIRAVNAIGSGAATATSVGTPTAAAVVPGAPSITSVTRGDSQLTVAFTAGSDGGSVITNYEYSTDAGSTWTTRSPIATTSPIIITGLTNGTSYNVQIRAVNSVGSGAATTSTSGTPSTTPGTPTITGITAGEYQLSVAFSAGSTGGSTITNYEYSIDGGGTWTTRSPVATTSPIIITSLTNGTSYNVQLKAINANGHGTATTTTVGTPRAQTKVYISTTGNDANDGLTIGNPVLTFSKGISLVSANTTDVYVAAGTYNETATATLNAVTSSVTIHGDNAKTTIIQQTTAATRIMVNGTAHRGSNNSLTIQDMTFKGGSYTGGGGAAINYQETAGYKNNLTLNRVIFEGNTVTTSGSTTQNGGALTFAGNNLTVNDCYFKNNSVVSGAAATGNGLISAGGAIYITNSAAVGSIYHDGVFVSINNTTFDGNSAVSKGGAILAASSSNRNVSAPNSYVKCTNCTFINNKATKNPTSSAETEIVTGSAFSASTSTNSVTMIYDFVFTNCTFMNNKGGGTDGSGTSVYESKATIDVDGTQWTTATFVNNIINTTSTANCGAALMVNSATGGSKISATNNIIQSVYTTYITDACLNGSAVSNNNSIGSDATNVASTLTDNSTGSVYAVPYLILNSGSSAIGIGVGTYGSPNIVPSTDARGQAIVGIKDLGAYESPFNPTISITGTLSAVNTNYGTASTSPTTFSVSGTEMLAGILVTPPAGYEVSLTEGSGYASTVTVSGTGTISSTPIYVRIAATSPVASYSGNIVLSSIGAISTNAATASSTVSKAVLTITASNQSVPNGTAAATVTGAGTYTPTGFVNGEGAGVIGGSATYSTTYTNSTAVSASGITITPIVSGLTATNYSFTPADGTITITSPLTVEVSGDANLSSFSPSSVTDVTVLAGKMLTVDQALSVKSLTVNPGGKLTINAALTSVNGITLQSSAAGTATMMDSYTEPTVNATVQQWVTAGRNWYMSSPITLADYTLLNRGTGGVNVVEWNEVTKHWDNVTSETNSGKLVTGKGYIQIATSTPSVTGTTGTIDFNGTTNSGNVALQLTRTESGASRGFNLVGNPYPSYLDWAKVAAANTNILPTTWLRTKNTGGSYTFATINVMSYLDNAENTPIITSNSANTTITSYIPPLQAYWVRLNANPASTTYTVTNAMRDHGDNSGNTFKAPAKKTSLQPLLRLQVSNGTNSDEAVIYFNSHASNEFDAYDSPKMTNSSVSIPEIYTLAGTEQLVINGLNNIQYDTELPIGFTTGQSNTFSLKASQFSNFEAGTQIILKDYLDVNNPVITDLSDGSSYLFSSSITSNNSSRFTLTFRAPSVATGINGNGNNENLWVSSNANGQIVVNGANDKTTVAVYNSVGQKLSSTLITSTYSILKNPLTPGVYMVTVCNVGKTITKKIIVN